MGYLRVIQCVITPFQCISSRNKLESIAKKRQEAQEALETQILEAQIECERFVVPV